MNSINLWSTKSVALSHAGAIILEGVDNSSSNIHNINRLNPAKTKRCHVGRHVQQAAKMEARHMRSKQQQHNQGLEIWKSMCKKVGVNKDEIDPLKNKLSGTTNLSKNVQRIDWKITGGAAEQQFQSSTPQDPAILGGRSEGLATCDTDIDDIQRCAMPSAPPQDQINIRGLK
uniref:Uncharacterized protein n=1 Tax=Oryza rufipogon TaxID=4529 RepID=A0A0E0NMA6_ORYRU